MDATDSVDTDISAQDGHFALLVFGNTVCGGFLYKSIDLIIRSAASHGKTVETGPITCKFEGYPRNELKTAG